MTYSRGQHFGRFTLRLGVPEIQDIQSRKCTEPQTELEHLSYSVYTKDLPDMPKSGPFHSTTSSFQDTRSRKIGNAPNDPKLNLNTQQSKTALHWILTQDVQIWVHFALQQAVSGIQGCQKSVNDPKPNVNT